MKPIWPYLAVILDSFHAALSSRILWIAFVAIWILLGALSPIGYREDYTTTFLDRDLDNASRLKAMLAQGLVDPNQASKPAGRIAAALSEDLKRQLRQVGEGEDVRIWFSKLSDSLNELFDDETWYDPVAWQSTVRLRELRELDPMDAEAMSDSLRARRTRLRIEAALPGVFQSRSARSIRLTYFGMDFPARLAIDKTQFRIVLNQMVLPTIINWLLGFILVFLGILVTASIVPDMLQPGSLHLLLSKPISRSMLLISKFIGGCAFVCLCVIQLVIGLYLISGLRLDVWNARVLLCIPVSVFVFAVFYSVSVFAGLRWRSPILAIGVTCMFGAFCVVVGFIGGFFDVFVSRPDSLKHLAISGDEVFATTRGEGLLRWDAAGQQWDEVFESEALGADRVLPPVTLDDGSIATARVVGGRMNVFGMGAFDLLVLTEPNRWRPQPSLRLPTATTRLLVAGDDLLAVNTSGAAITSQSKVLQGVAPDPDASEGASVEPESSASAENTPSSQPDWMAKLSSMMGVPTAGFENILPKEIALNPPRTFAIDSSGDSLVFLSGKDLFSLHGNRDAGIPATWTRTAEETLFDELPRFASLATGGGHVVVATQTSELRVLETATLEEKALVTLPQQLTCLALVALGDQDRFVVLTSDKRCRILEWNSVAKTWDMQKEIPVKKVETVEYVSKSNQIVLAHHLDQVDFLDAEHFGIRRFLRPHVSRWRQVDRYLMTPLRTLTPQTGELGGTVAAIISGETSVEFHRDASGPVELVRYKILEPVLSCSLFILLMMTLSCVYFRRSDF
ncbi:ABC transporter permease [Novipirellula artificiosorum]|uniref:ABC-2 family transporter protein n=1 Tax=Novipirellula artificiosorum TaxID=2528016 RepID=A0A5C6E1U4_9BACT|nr:ABC transporter permease [Novipirellula artificiosorum]TWU42860.1 ABC-2 family transporter protein [Novipirellula artificiosorum]